MAVLLNNEKRPLRERRRPMAATFATAIRAAGFAVTGRLLC
jgi:hypothetical protein